MNNSFFDKVSIIVSKIPYGKVTTYGEIAAVCGLKSSARTVGWALKSLKHSNLPCHRVVNRNGELTGKLNFATPTLMKELLENENIPFIDGDKVDLKQCLWIPK